MGIKIKPMVIHEIDGEVTDYYVHVVIQRGNREREHYQCVRDHNTGEVTLPENVKPLERGKGGMIYVTCPYDGFGGTHDTNTPSSAVQP